MPSPTNAGRSILRREAAGFFFMIALIWLTELIRLPHLILGEPPEFNWLRVLMRTAIILGIWGWVHLNTRRLLRRLHELEGFLLVCSWCRRVGHERQWLTMEEYFGSQLATETTHGICPDCAQQQIQAHHAAVRVRTKP